MRLTPSLVGTLIVCVIAMAPPAAAASGGDLDPSFGTGGRVSTGRTFSGTDVALQSDGKIVVGGAVADNEGVSRSAVERYDTDGNLDPSFGIDGLAVTPFRLAAGCWDATTAVVPQADGKIVAVGFSYCARSVFAVARYDTNGTLDPSYGTGGKVLTSFGPSGACSSHAEAGAIQSDGRVVAAGVMHCRAGDYRFAVARYAIDGTLDSGFGHGGEVRTNFTPGYDDASGVALTPGGRIVVVGTSSFGDSDKPDAQPAFALARYRRDGTLDPTFGGDGTVMRSFQSRRCGGGAEADAVAIQDDGKIVAAGLTGCSAKAGAVPTPSFALARLRWSGAFDPTFGGDGRVTTVFRQGDRADRALDVAIQGNGAIVAGGIVGVTETDDRSFFGLARYTPGGRLDRTFGGDGKVTTAFGGRHCSSDIRAIVIQPHGRIVATGSSCAGLRGPKFSMARYLPS